MVSSAESIVSLRVFCESDFADVAAMLAGLQERVADVDPLKVFVHDDDFDRAAYLNSYLRNIEIETGRIIVAEQECRLVGAVVGWIKNVDHTTDLERRTHRFGYVSDLYVMPECRKSGLGKRLMTAIEDWFAQAGCEYTKLDCMADNDNARRLYLQSGYVEESVTMVKPLGGHRTRCPTA